MLCNTELKYPSIGKTCAKALYHGGKHVSADAMSRADWAAYRAGTKQKLRKRERDLQRAYGITPDDYSRMLAKQDGTCAVCGGPPNGPGAKNGLFHVDHDHVTGKNRGLLCSRCNVALGQLDDDPERLRRAATYLEETR